VGFAAVASVAGGTTRCLRHAVPLQDCQVRELPFDPEEHLAGECSAAGVGDAEGCEIEAGRVGVEESDQHRRDPGELAHPVALNRLEQCVHRKAREQDHADAGTDADAEHGGEPADVEERECPQHDIVVADLQHIYRQRAVLVELEV